MENDTQNVAGDTLRGIKVLYGELPINTLLEGLDGLRFNNNGVVYALGKRIIYKNGLKVCFVPYVVKVSCSNKGLKLDVDFKPKIDKSKYAGARCCKNCKLGFKVYNEVKGGLKRLVSDEGLLIGSVWICNKCGVFLSSDKDINKKNGGDFLLMTKADFMQKYPNITEETYNKECGGSK